MNIKLVAIDLDDTLLDSELKISDRCINDIKQVQEKGVIVTLATGRMYRSALPYAMQLDADVPIITYQGALVKKSKSGKILYNKPVPVDKAVEVLEYFKNRDVHCHTYFNDNLCVERITEEANAYARLAGVTPVIVEDLIAACRSGEETLKIMAVLNNEYRLLAMERELKQAYAGDLYITRSKPYFLEIVNPEANKADALRLVSSLYGVDREEVLAVGDSYNDLEMIQWAGVGVAMKNAWDVVKATADYVTASNEEDGVAEVLERFILEEK